MGKYMLQISNPVNKHFSTIHSFTFTLSVHSAIQTQVSENIRLPATGGMYTGISFVPFFAGVWEYTYVDARAPPPVIYQEV